MPECFTLLLVVHVYYYFYLCICDVFIWLCVTYFRTRLNEELAKWKRVQKLKNVDKEEVRTLYTFSNPSNPLCARVCCRTVTSALDIYYRFILMWHISSVSVLRLSINVLYRKGISLSQIECVWILDQVRRSTTETWCAGAKHSLRDDDHREC